MAYQFVSVMPHHPFPFFDFGTDSFTSPCNLPLDPTDFGSDIDIGGFPSIFASCYSINLSRRSRNTWYIYTITMVFVDGSVVVLPRRTSTKIMLD